MSYRAILFVREDQNGKTKKTWLSIEPEDSLTTILQRLGLVKIKRVDEYDDDNEVVEFDETIKDLCYVMTDKYDNEIHTFDCLLSFDYKIGEVHLKKLYKTGAKRERDLDQGDIPTEEQEDLKRKKFCTIM